jgi:2'-5' RNA ligase
LIGETGLIVQVAEAEPFVRDLRARFDFRSSEGVPAHITVLHPFVPYPLPRTSLDLLEEIFLSRDAFEFRLTKIGRWPDNLHLLPQPAEPFVALTRAVWAAFPNHPPYEGRFADIVPHLSVAQGGTELLDEAEPLLGQAIPPSGIAGICREISLLTLTGSTWEVTYRFPLRQPPASS